MSYATSSALTIGETIDPPTDAVIVQRGDLARVTVILAGDGTTETELALEGGRVHALSVSKLVATSSPLVGLWEATP
jgi:hypothetical protein